MTACKRLQHVAMRNVELMGDLALPDGCLLHAITQPGYQSQSLYHIKWQTARLVTGVSVRHTAQWRLDKGHCHRVQRSTRCSSLEITVDF